MSNENRVGAFRENTYALILGASSGFGAATARAFARAGVGVFGVHFDRAATMPAVDALERELRATGVDVRLFNVNAADANARAGVVEEIAATLGRAPGASLRTVLHSLAFGSLRPFVGDSARTSLTASQVEMTLDVMASSLIYWTQDLVFRGLLGDGGRIFGLTSSGSHKVLPMYGAVSAAKAALESICRQLAFELAGRGITVNAIQAGVTETPALSKIPGAEAIKVSALHRNPHGRLTTPDDVANLIVLLSQTEAAWVNGTVITVDGGEDIVDVNWQWQEKSV